MHFRKKPVVIEAKQWLMHGDHPAVTFLPAGHPAENVKSDNFTGDDYGWCPTLEGGHVVTPGDWIITGVKGENYPCKPDIFAATYEAAAALTGAQPAPAAPTKQGRALPNPGSPEASAMLDSLLAEYQWPANSKNAARAGWEAANRWLAAAPAAQPADSAMEVLRELVDNNDNAPDNRDTAAVNAWLPRWHAAWRRARTLSAASNKESQHG